jgi:hypothetical protein
VQTTHPGTIQLDGDTATGRAYIQELARARDGRQGLNYAIYHSRYRRTPDGWKFTEWLYEVRYLDHSPLAGSAPRPAGAPADPPAGDKAAVRGGRCDRPGDQRRMRSQINVIRAAADPRSRRSLGEQNGGSLRGVWSGYGRRATWSISRSAAAVSPPIRLLPALSTYGCRRSSRQPYSRGYRQSAMRRMEHRRASGAEAVPPQWPR